MPFVGFPFIFLVQESHLAWKEVFLELRFQRPTCMKVLLVARVIENRGKRSMDPMHQEDHTFLFWLYKAVIRSKKT